MLKKLTPGFIRVQLYLDLTQSLREIGLEEELQGRGVVDGHVTHATGAVVAVHATHRDEGLDEEMQNGRQWKDMCFD
jgi:hypothetical protein